MKGSSIGRPPPERGLAYFSRHRASGLALGISLLFHAVLLGWLGNDVLVGSELWGLRSSSAAAAGRVGLLSPSNPLSTIAGRLGRTSGFEYIQPPLIQPHPVPRLAPEARAVLEPGAPGGAQRLSSDPMPREGGPLPEIRYFPADELSVKPELVSDAGSSEATYIPDILPLPVLVQILINEQGDVDRVLLGENFLSNVAQRYILESFAKMKFSPGRLGSRAVKSQLQIVVNLDPAMTVN